MNPFRQKVSGHHLHPAARVQNRRVITDPTA